jgi:RNA polymerase sigma-70 factor (ECF subfamily)
MRPQIASLLRRRRPLARGSNLGTRLRPPVWQQQPRGSNARICTAADPVLGDTLFGRVARSPIVARYANESGAPSLDQTETSRRVAPASDAEDERLVIALVDRAREGDAEAFGRLYDRFQPEIVRYLTHRTGDPEVAQDLSQQVFLKAWQAIPRYQHRGAPFRAWLYRMAHNQMVDHFRARRQTVDVADVELPEEAEAETLVLTKELNAQLKVALDGLSEDHRQVLVLRFLMEKSAREIGDIMGRKEVTIRGLQMRALQALRKEIETMGGLP